MSNLNAQRRPYVSPVRVEQAAATRERIIAAARECFEEAGWSGTTLAQIAGRAKVSPQAVHLSVGSKPALLRAALVSAVGAGTTDEPGLESALFDAALRPGLTLRRRVHGFVDATTSVHERAGGLFRVLAQASQTDEELADWRTDIAARRLVLCRTFVTAAGVGRSRHRRVTDLVFVLSSTSVFYEFQARGWTLPAYTSWLRAELARLLANT